MTDIKRTTSNENVQFLLLDLLNLQSVRQFAEEIVKSEDKIDILVNNAGIADGRKNGVSNPLHCNQVFTLNFTRA